MVMPPAAPNSCLFVSESKRQQTISANPLAMPGGFSMVVTPGKGVWARESLPELGHRARALGAGWQPWLKSLPKPCSFAP
jgi:hypothetical protein